LESQVHLANDELDYAKVMLREIRKILILMDECVEVREEMLRKPHSEYLSDEDLYPTRAKDPNVAERMPRTGLAKQLRVEEPGGPQVREPMREPKQSGWFKRLTEKLFGRKPAEPAAWSPSRPAGENEVIQTRAKSEPLSFAESRRMNRRAASLKEQTGKAKVIRVDETQIRPHVGKEASRSTLQKKVRQPSRRVSTAKKTFTKEAVSKIVKVGTAIVTMTGLYFGGRELVRQWTGSPGYVTSNGQTEEAKSGEEAYDGMVVTAPDCDYGGLIKEIAALDAMTVQISMCVPEPAFPSKAALSAFSIQPKEWIEAAMESGEILENPVGTGPYMLDAWNREDSIVFKRFDDYWGEPAKTDTLVFRWAADGAQRKSELESGTVDGIDNPDPADFDDLQANGALAFYPRTAMNVFYIAFNNTSEPFDDVNVRKAVALSIDRQRIVDNFFPKGSEVASHFAPCFINNGCVGDAWHDYNLSAAINLLAEAGYPDGFETTIYYRDVFRYYLPEPGLVAAEIQAQLADLGIKAEVVAMEPYDFLSKAISGRLDGIYLLGLNAVYPHITNFLDFHFAASNPQFGDAYPGIYEPLQQASQIADPAVAEPLYIEANNALKELVPMIPVAHGGSVAVYQTDVDGAHSSPLGNEYFAVMGGRDTLIWMQKAEPFSLYCNDEADIESLRACAQVLESLLAFEVGETSVKPGLATSCDPNEDLTTWTCHLREGVKFHDGSTLDANDVVMSWVVAWDAAHPLHIGNTGVYDYFYFLWDNLLNAE